MGLTSGAGASERVDAVERQQDSHLMIWIGRASNEGGPPLQRRATAPSSPKLIVLSVSKRGLNRLRELRRIEVKDEQAAAVRQLHNSPKHSR
ncbi:MAG: hypothetical protein JSR91_28620 [Proteobacteria bacterium]|nr:hypothetical protein [Pseudomonadota bacterium]